MVATINKTRPKPTREEAFKLVDAATRISLHGEQADCPRCGKSLEYEQRGNSGLLHPLSKPTPQNPAQTLRQMGLFFLKNINFYVASCCLLCYTNFSPYLLLLNNRRCSFKKTRTDTDESKCINT